MPTHLRSPRPLLLAGMLISAHCGPPASLQYDVNQVRNRVFDHEVKFDKLEADNKRLANELDRLKREKWSERLCKGGKLSSQIAEFLTQVQAQIPHACTPLTMQSALMFLKTQPYAVAYLAPQKPMKSMEPMRREVLLDFLAPETLHPSTRILVLVQPADESHDGEDDALRLGSEFADFITQKVYATIKIPVLGPHLLPCQLRPEVKKLFRSTMDERLRKEPQESQPGMRVLVFKSDC